MALVQRSCGYALRPTLTLEEIERAVATIKAQNPDVIVAVDNCYGEFTDTREPPAVSCGLQARPTGCSFIACVMGCSLGSPGWRLPTASHGLGACARR